MHRMPPYPLFHCLLPTARDNLMASWEKWSNTVVASPIAVLMKDQVIAMSEANVRP